MKQLRNLILFTVVLIFISGCGETKKENKALKEEIAKIKAESEKYKSEKENLSVTIENFKSLLSEIEKNQMSLDEDNAQLIKLKGTDEMDSKVTIVDRLARISATMENSKLKILALDKNLKALRKQYGEKSEEVLQLSREIKIASQKLIDKEAEFNEIKAELKDDNDELESAYSEQLKIAEDLKKIIDRAFYVASIKKELNDKKIITKEGGFIGIGKVKILNANSPEQLFTEISKEKTDSLAFECKSIDLITNHGEGSFEINSTKGKTVLKILDKKGFWSKSNYLVIQKSE